MAGSTGERRDPWLRGELTEGENQPSWAERASGPPAFPWRKAGGRGPSGSVLNKKEVCACVCDCVASVLEFGVFTCPSVRPGEEGVQSLAGKTALLGRRDPRPVPRPQDRASRGPQGSARCHPCVHAFSVTERGRVYLSRFPEQEIRAEKGVWPSWESRTRPRAPNSATIVPVVPPAAPISPLGKVAPAAGG